LLSIGMAMELRLEPWHTDEHGHTRVGYAFAPVAVAD
jgi:hypothetical protein